MRLEDAALLFATQKHIGQTRKFNNLPYIVHPIRVASLVAKQLENTSHKEEVISSVVAAAYLHDTLEDTETTVEELTREFSPAIASLVQELTVPAEIDNGYQKKQVLNSELQVVSEAPQDKNDYLIQSINSMSDGAKLIKIADRYDNIRDCPKGTKYCNKYVDKTLYILNGLVQLKTTMPPEAMLLFDSVFNFCREYKRSQKVGYLYGF